MLDVRDAAALSALPGTLGAHLLAITRSRLPPARCAGDEVAVPGDFDLEAELATLFHAPEALSRAAQARTRGRRALEAAAHANLIAVPFGSPTYPALLARIPDAPPMLWVSGNVEAASQPAIAIVGSRAASPLSL